jgi:hypothetical protein
MAARALLERKLITGHGSKQRGQRGWKRQPGGQAPAEGTLPGISGSRVPRGASAGIERSNPCV